MPELTPRKSSAGAEASIVWPGLGLVVAASAILASWPDASRSVLGDVLRRLTDDFGWLYLILGFSCFLFMLWLAFGRFGRIKLGTAEDVPEFSNLSWVAMLMCAGIGIAMVNWAFTEPIYFLMHPPLGAAPGSSEAVELAAMYPFQHWGVLPWSIFLVPALPVAYSMYVRRDPHLRFSHACQAVIGEAADGALGKLIDFFVILSIIGGVGTSLALGIPLVTRIAGHLLGVEDSFGLNLAVVGVWTLIFGWSVYRGLESGIRVLSNLNAALAVALLLFVLAIGPTGFILNLWANSFGLAVENFVRASFWTDPVAHQRFPQDWTVFYWAWWIAYSPMMAIFVGRISRGRTVREVLLNGTVWPSLGSWAFFAIWGGYSIHLTTQGLLPVDRLLTEHGTPTAVIAILETMPLAHWIVPIFLVLSFVFLATTLDSAAYAVACVCTREMPARGDPPRWLRMLWTGAIAGLGIGLTVVGGQDAARLSTTVGAFPLIFILAVLALSFWRWIHRDFGEITATKPLTLPAAGGVVHREEGET